MIKAYIEKLGGQHTSLQAYIGVYTKEPLSIYSIVMTKKVEFAPIQLKLGQILSGRVVHEKKMFYYVQTSGEGQAVKIDLLP